MYAERTMAGDDDITLRLEVATFAAQPEEELARLVLAMTAEGMSQATVYACFDAHRARHADDVDEHRYEAILTVMDRICGWCAADQRLFATDLPP